MSGAKIVKVFLLLSLLNLENFLLLFNLSAKFLFRRKIGEILCGKELRILVENRVSGYVLARLGTEDEADGRIVSLSALKVVIHPDIHIHLTDILMAYLGGLQVDKQKSLEQVVVEYKIYVKIANIGGYVLLACHECIAFAKFKKEIGTHFAVLLLKNNPPTDIPVGVNH